MASSSQILTSEECGEFENILVRKYAASLRSRFFSITCEQSTDQWVLVTLILQNPDRSFYYPVEGRYSLTNGALQPKEAALLLLDYIDFYFTEFFAEEEQIFIPINWTNYHFDGADFQLKGQILDQKREEMANQLLQC